MPDTVETLDARGLRVKCLGKRAENLHPSPWNVNREPFVEVLV